ncbi:hypothetical protein [uncultured Phycicoccus sp.]|uniref:hypothetical protein n=1 Tax=uncultured Phycicoccus sp. TaxID=661422 RepID=UPI00261340DF|nr:hypothetical protein [uncultured Phycicoccus sp.]
MSPGLGPWRLVRRGLKVARGTVVALTVLAAVTTTYLVVTARVESRAADVAIADTVSQAPAQAREVGLSALPAVVPSRPDETGDPREGPTAPFEAVDEALRDVLGPEVVALLEEPTWAAQTEPLAATRPGGEAIRPDGTQAVVRVQSGLAERVEWTSGGAPGPALDEVRTITGPTGAAHPARVVPVAVSAGTARSWGLRVGDALDLTPVGDQTPMAAVVSGVFVPLEPTDGFWAAEPRMAGLAAIPTPQGGVVPQGALVAAAESYGAVSDSLWRTPPEAEEPAESPVLAATWRYPLDAGRLTQEDVEPMRRVLVRLATDSRLVGLTARPLETTTGLAGLLDRYDSAVAGARVLTSFATAGLTALAVLVLALTAIVAVRRRAPEIRLLRARGGSVRQVVAQVGTGTAGSTLPVVALAAVAGMLLVPGTTGTDLWLQVAAVGLVPVLATAGAALAQVRELDRSDASEDAVRQRRVVRLARRLVAETGVLAVAVLAVLTVQARGGQIAAGRTDWYAALTPVLVAIAVSLLVLRLLPWPVRWASGLAGRGRGLVAFVGLARAARTGAVAAVPVVAVVVGSSVLALFAALSLTIQDEREVASYRAVGAPARVDALRVDPEDIAALEARPGVGVAVAAYVESAQLVAGSRAEPVELVATDAAAYARVVAGTPLALPAVPGVEGDPLPVVAGALPDAEGGVELLVRGVRIPVRAAALDEDLVRDDGTRAVPMVVVDLARLREVVPAAQPDTAFLTVDDTGAAALDGLRDPGSLTPSGRVTGVATAGAVTDRVAALALPRLVAGTYAVGAGLAALLTLLAVALLLAATRPDRTVLVLRLRAMGLRDGGERALAWAEVLPVVAFAAVSGALVGTLAPRLVETAVDLSPLTGGLTRPGLPPHVPTAVGAGVFVLVLGALALVLDAASARRGSLADHLRGGDPA